VGAGPVGVHLLIVLALRLQGGGSVDGRAGFFRA